MTAWNIQQYYDYKIKQGLSGNTVIKHHSNIHTALKLAVRMGKIEHNPSDNIELPKKEPYRANYYTPNEIVQLLNIIKNTPLYHPVLLSSILGLRRSEALGLTWNSVDFIRKTITVEKKVVPFVRTKKLSIQNKVKTASSYRTLPLPLHLLNYLLELKEHQLSKYPDNEFICINEKGQLLNPDYVTKKFSDVITKHNLKKIRFHDLRHSCASILTSLGFNLKQIQDWLGHSDIQTTANYAHIFCYDKENMAEKIGHVININL